MNPQIPTESCMTSSQSETLEIFKDSSHVCDAILKKS